MNKSIVFHLLGIVLIPILVGLAISLGVGFAMGEDWRGRSALGFYVALAVTLVIALLFRWLGRGEHRRIFRREALCSVGMGWILASLLGAIPLWVGLPGVTLADAVFEATSGITTTGATVLSGLDSMEKSILFWRSMTQWIGGLGVVVLFVALLSSLGAGGKILFSNESTGSVADFEQGRVQNAAFQIMALYGGLSVACFIAYRVAGMDNFDACLHAFSTVSTAGFSTLDASIGGFNNAAIEWVAIVFMFLGGVTFVYLLRLVKGKQFSLAKNGEVVAYALIFAGASAIVAFWNLTAAIDPESVHSIIRGSVFQVVSLGTTTGFATEDYTHWPIGGQVILLLLMLIGGTSGSTSGGAKVGRIVIAAKSVTRSVMDAFRPHMLRPIRMNGRVLEETAVSSVLGFLALLGLVALLGMLIVSMLEPGLDLMSAFSAVQATLFNIGPGFSAFGPSETYASLSSATKFFLSSLMILGRLELYAILVLFAPSFWRRYS